MQRAAIRMVPPRFREAAHRSSVRQERFARKYGLTLLTISLNVMVLSLMASLTYVLLLEAFERGWIAPRP